MKWVMEAIIFVAAQYLRETPVYFQQAALKAQKYSRLFTTDAFSKVTQAIYCSINFVALCVRIEIRSASLERRRVLQVPTTCNYFVQI